MKPFKGCEIIKQGSQEMRFDKESYSLKQARKNLKSKEWVLVETPISLHYWVFQRSSAYLHRPKRTSQHYWEWKQIKESKTKAEGN